MGHNKEFKRFLFIVLASNAEVETQLIIADKLNYIEKIKLESISKKNRQA
ncbi:MAG: four helix bundle protein [Candidatus Omnitrophota bacterium]|nr:four helix bundle protein [Candidatus Omnitrophota bacterium]